jgi:hypothetical protein
MKKVTFLTTARVALYFVATVVVACILFVSCTKEGEEDDDEIENHCPVIAASAVPQIVKDAFVVRYPSRTVITWYQKDGIGYCAYFIEPVKQKKLAEFTTTGSFVKEEIDLEQDGNFQDPTGLSNSKVPGECECEIPD